MRSKNKEVFGLLKPDGESKRECAERMSSAQSIGAGQPLHTGMVGTVKAHKPVFAGRRGASLLTAAVLFVGAFAVFAPLATSCSGGGLLKAMSLLKDAFVDMDGVAAFGVWNAPDSDSETARMQSVSYLHRAPYSADTDISVDGNAADSDTSADADNPDEEKGGVITGDWSDDERYDWESDYDWDPTKANVLVSIDEDGKMKEVVYERTNGRGQIRQDVLGHAVKVYVSDGFTYVMYVNDDEWEFWQEINFAQETVSSNGFSCHHESAQTVVIHNATGKVFALKDIIPQVNELSGATNYTMQAEPFEDDFLYIRPMYGSPIPQWYNVLYDEQSEKIRYELVLPADSDAVKSYSTSYNLLAARRDKYGQQYLLEGNWNYGNGTTAPRVPAGIVNLPSYTRYGNSLVFSTPNGMMLGTDGRMYAFDEGKLKVFGENFELRPVEAGTEVAFEGVADDFGGRASQANDGIAYKLEGGYLYSMFGEVWKISDDGTMSARERLEGSFPRFADDGYLLGGEIIAFVDTELSNTCMASVNGRMVQICFDSTGDAPRAVVTHIIDASEISVRNHRMVVEQNERPYSLERGETKYFLLTVQNGTPSAEYFAYGCDGGVRGLTNPITEPIQLN